MKKNKGFTLVELLGVIVVLAVISLITTPLILNVIEKSKKGALQDSAYGLIDAAGIYYANQMLEGNEKTEFMFQNGIQTSENKLSYKGKIENGSLRLYSDGKSAVCITEGDYAAIKNVNEKTVTVVKGRCSYNSETEEYETVGLCQDLQDEIEALKKKHQEEMEALKKEYEEKLSQAGSDKDQIIQDYEEQLKNLEDSYQAQLEELNNQLNTFKTGGNVLATEILSGKTAYVQGQFITGSMKNNSGVTKDGTDVTESGENALIGVPEAGYYDETSKISVSIENIRNNVTTLGSKDLKLYSGSTTLSSNLTNYNVMTIPEDGYIMWYAVISAPDNTTGKGIYMNTFAGQGFISRNAYISPNFGINKAVTAGTVIKVSIQYANNDAYGNATCNWKIYWSSEPFTIN